MTFPLYRRPGAIIFLDDDLDYLEMLADVMPADWYVRLMLRPIAFIDTLLIETEALELDKWNQQEIINRWRNGTALIPQILAYWQRDSSVRFSLARLCVVDYSMPAMSGLKALSEVTLWPGSRILLTGRADEQLAVSAFNSGLIQKFIPKQSPDIRMRLTEAIEKLLQKPDERLDQTWRGTLSREQGSLLVNSTIAAGLGNLAAAQRWVEYVVIGEPFGILSLDDRAQVSWLQLESPSRLEELAEIAESQAWNTQAVQDVRSGKKLIDFELQLALGSNQKPRLRDALVIGSGPLQLYAAVFDVGTEFCPKPIDSFQNFIASHSLRPVQH